MIEMATLNKVDITFFLVGKILSEKQKYAS